ncbi:hypothetical protein HOC32_04645 [Candidatus Woesearchaeota archaeon]|nr:hypothetical protein [Candidatus Woesearchaeota archaeon]
MVKLPNWLSKRFVGESWAEVAEKIENLTPKEKSAETTPKEAPAHLEEIIDETPAVMMGGSPTYITSYSAIEHTAVSNELRKVLPKTIKQFLSYGFVSREDHFCVFPPPNLDQTGMGEAISVLNGLKTNPSFQEISAKIIAGEWPVDLLRNGKEKLLLHRRKFGSNPDLNHLVRLGLDTVLFPEYAEGESYVLNNTHFDLSNLTTLAKEKFVGNPKVIAKQADQLYRVLVGFSGAHTSSQLSHLQYRKDFAQQVLEQEELLLNSLDDPFASYDLEQFLTHIAGPYGTQRLQHTHSKEPEELLKEVTGEIYVLLWTCARLGDISRHLEKPGKDLSVDYALLAKDILQRGVKRFSKTHQTLSQQNDWKTMVMSHGYWKDFVPYIKPPNQIKYPNLFENLPFPTMQSKTEAEPQSLGYAATMDSNP